MSLSALTTAWRSTKNPVALPPKNIVNKEEGVHIVVQLVVKKILRFSFTSNKYVGRVRECRPSERSE